MSCHIRPNTELERGAAGGQPSSSFEETNPFSKQSKHRMHNPSIGYTLYYLLYVHDATFMYRSWLEPSCIRFTSLIEIPCLPYDGLER
jgi:hypothetical protein